MWANRKMTRREFLRWHGIASSALTFSPFFLERMSAVCQAANCLTRVYKVQNGDCFQNINKLWEMLDGPTKYIGPTDVVVIKANAQWPKQGYTHTGAIKAVVDQILAIPQFTGEVLICDNVQNTPDQQQLGFSASPENRANNWPDKNWDELAEDYQAAGRPVATVRWTNDPVWREPGTLPFFSAWDPKQGEGWSRSLFTFYDRPTYLSYPVFASPLTPGRMIDVKHGVWEDGSYTGRKVKAIIMPTLNNHGEGAEDYAGVTSAVKSFFGATEIFQGDNHVWNGFFSIHSSSFTQNCAYCMGELVGRYLQTMFSPVLYITPAICVGWQSRTGQAAATNTVLACENPVSLDYISCRDIISRFAPWLNPDAENNTRGQLAGCSAQGIGTLDPGQMDVVSFDFNNPTATRLDIDRKIRDFRAGKASEQDVKDVIQLYMSYGS